MIEKDEFIDIYIKPEYQPQLRKKLNEAENFFKHVDRDHASTLEFNPDQSELQIFDAMRQYWKLIGKWPPMVGLFLNWYVVNHQEFFKLTEVRSFYFSSLHQPHPGH